MNFRYVFSLFLVDMAHSRLVTLIRQKIQRNWRTVRRKIHGNSKCPEKFVISIISTIERNLDVSINAQLYNTLRNRGGKSIFVDIT